MHFQAAFVLDIGLKLKPSDLICFIILIFSFTNINFKTKLFSLPLFILFFILPFFSTLYHFINLGNLSIFNEYPELFKTARYNPFIASIQGIVYGLMIYSLISNVVLKSDLADKYIHLFTISGTAVNFYALFAMIWVGQLGMFDLVPSFLDVRNSNPIDYPYRTIGFSNEPGSFAFLASLVTIFSFYHCRKFPTIKNLLLLFINFIASIFTFSASIFLFYFIILVYFMRTRFFIILLISVLIVMPIISNFDSDTLYLVQYLLVDRPFEFISIIFSFSEATIDGSGGQRASTFLAGLGVAALTYFIGTGPGNSYLYMFDSARILNLTSKVFEPGIFPQNIFTHTIAEYGLIGLVCIFLFIIRLFIKTPITTKIMALHFIIFGLSISPTYSIYLYIGLAFGLTKFESKSDKFLF